MDAYETSIYTAVILTGLILGCVILYFIWSVTRHQKRFIELHRSYFLNEVRLLEKERYRIARDLHDELGPLVSVTKMHLQVLETADQQQKILERTIENTALLMKRMEEITNNLTPGALQKKGLVFVLEDFIEDVRVTEALNICYRFEGLLAPAAEEGIHIYRIVKELVHNCLKHAHASQLVLTLKVVHHTIQIYYEDDGGGFAISDCMQQSERYGLRSIRSRVEMLGGRLSYASRAGKGTIYSITIPISLYAHADQTFNCR
jgi:two-component system, NarL family, sensor kinase